jgi:hypothetical protein
MPLLIDVETAPPGPPPLITLEVGDLVAFSAPGAVVESGTALEPMGAFVRALPGPDGRPLVPQGPPNVVLFRASSPGEAILRVTIGYVWAAGTNGASVRITVR